MCFYLLKVGRRQKKTRFFFPFRFFSVVNTKTFFLLNLPFDWDFLRQSSGKVKITLCFTARGECFIFFLINLKFKNEFSWTLTEYYFLFFIILYVNMEMFGKTAIKSESTLFQRLKHRHQKKEEKVHSYGSWRSLACRMGENQRVCKKLINFNPCAPKKCPYFFCDAGVQP